MLNFILRLFFGTKTERDIKKLKPTVDLINSLDPEIKKLTDENLSGKTNEFKQRLRDGETLDDILPETFAVVRETARRILGERPYDVQIMGGITLHQGKIAEMKTGEGKTLASTMPIYLNALSENGVHVITVNDYLAKRDREWMGPIYEFLGLSIGVIQHDMPLEHKQLAYNCDITYGTNNEFGFDYLRDNMVPQKEMKMQRKLNFCIIDEVDSILIDEARTPLIISGPSEESTDKYYKVSKIVSLLIKDDDFELDEKSKSVYLTEKGSNHAEKLLKIDNMFTTKNIEYQHHVTQAIRAKYLFKSDVDYVVKDGKIVIVDEFTGRIMQGRRWSDGLHQAIEAKENVTIESENQTLATITFQNYFKIYNKISGMTGTAETEANEFMQIYKLDVIVIPTNKPIIRSDTQDQIYRTFKEKVNAIALEIKDKYQIGQPVLVGTISIERSEILSRELHKQNIPHQVLNAKYHEKEAQIIKQAGKKGSITIATNMAGRGTDIVLGGYADFKEELQDNIPVQSEVSQNFHQLIVQGNIEDAVKLLDDFKGPEKDNAIAVLCKTALRQFKFEIAVKYSEKISSHNIKEDIQKLSTRVIEWKKENEIVKDSGGLHILGTERHESRRIDNQLRGRAGRQGDSGTSRFFISLDDELMRLFGSDKIANIMQKLGLKENENIEHPWISKAIENAQKKVEGRNFEIRKHLLEYDNIMNKQREFIYQKRNEILDEANLKNDIIDAIKDSIELKMEQIFDKKSHADNWDFETFNNYLYSSFGTKIKKDNIDFKNQNFTEFHDYVCNHLIKIYNSREEQFTPDLTRQMERAIMLDIFDTKWKEHLYSMDQLKEGISWRAYGEKDPLVEYKFEGFKLFEDMIGQTKQEALDILFKVEPVGISEQIQAIMSEEDKFYGKATHSEYGQFDTLKLGPQKKERPADMQQSSHQPAIQIKRDKEKIGRNDPCWCGSGKKFKYCHGKN